MNGSEKVSEKTREKVLQAAHKLSYMPNPAARALSTNRSYTIAAVIPTFEHSIFARFLSTLEETFKSRNYSIVVAVSQSDLEEELRLAKNLLALGAEGFILSGINRHPELLPTLKQRNVPCIFTSYWAPDQKIPTIGYDNFQLSKSAVRYLYGEGHWEIAILHGPAFQNDRTQARINGALAAKKQGLALSFVETELSAKGGSDAVCQLMNESTPLPTAILAFSDVLALGAMFELGRRNLKVPDDISIMGFDNFEWAETCNPPLTTIDLPIRQMARSCANAMVDFLEKAQPIEAANIPGKILKRATVKSVPR